jgi:hypothetical protein
LLGGDVHERGAWWLEAQADRAAGTHDQGQAFLILHAAERQPLHTYQNATRLDPPCGGAAFHSRPPTTHVLDGEHPACRIG